MALPGIPISENECIGDSLWTINNALTSLDARAGSVTVSETPPSSPTEGDLWFDENSGILYMWYTDGSSNQWVDVGGGDSGSSAGAVNGIVQSDGAGNFSSAGLAANYLQTTNFTGTNQSLATNGYQKLPGGLIIQWTYATESTSNTNTRSWPIAFPNAVLLVAATPLDAGGVTSGSAFYSVTTTTFIFRYGDTYNNNQNGWVLGIGY